MGRSNNLFIDEFEFINRIHLDALVKLKELEGIIGYEILNLDKYSTLEKVTYSVMKEVRKSDKAFLLWLHAVGLHIKGKFKARWGIVKFKIIYPNSDIDYLAPIMVDDQMEIWKIGEFCHRAYYKNKRLYKISFLTFYKLEIERFIAHNKITKYYNSNDWQLLE